MAKEVRIHVKAVRREKPDLRKLARVLIQMAIAEQAKSGDQPEAGVLPEEEEAS